MTVRPLKHSHVFILQLVIAIKVLLHQNDGHAVFRIHCTLAVSAV